MQAWKIVEGFRGTKDMPEVKDFYQLPYDDELKTVAPDLSNWYNVASEEMANFNWPERTN